MPKKWPVAVMEAIAELLQDGFGPSQIVEELGRQGFPESNIPAERTMRDIVSILSPDKSQPWRLADSEGSDGRLVLEVLDAVIRRTEGRRCRVTVAEAEWIVRLRRAVVDPPEPPGSSWLWTAFLLARTYAALEATKEPTDALDAWIAFAPWRSEEEVRRYQNAVQEGWAPRLELNYFHTLGMVEVLRRMGIRIALITEPKKGS